MNFSDARSILNFLYDVTSGQTCENFYQEYSMDVVGKNFPNISLLLNYLYNVTSEQTLEKIY